MQSAPIQQQQRPAYFNQHHLALTAKVLADDLATSHKQIAGCPGIFHNGRITTMYARLTEMHKVLSEYTEAEWADITERIRRKEAAKGQQTALF